MKTENLTHIYFIPGMSASSKIFERIHLPIEKFKMHFLEWSIPLSKNESLQDYAKRFSKQITENNPIIVGVSFGGILAQEIAQIIPCKKLIIISSIKNPKEFSPFLKVVKTTKIHKLFPISLLNLVEKYLYKKGNKKTRNTLNTYRTFLPIRNKLYTQWSIHCFLHWKGCENKIDLIHLHGDKDSIIPLKYIQKRNLIRHGTHAMIITKSHTIQQHILQYLT